MVSIPVEIITIGIALMSPIYYGLWLLNQQDTTSAINRAQLTDNLNALTEKLTGVVDNLSDVTGKINSCKFCNQRKAVLDVIEVEDNDEWSFRSK